MTGEKQAGPAMDTAVDSLQRLADREGKWKPVYLAQPTTAPTSQPGLFDPRSAAPLTIDAADLAPTLKAIRQLKSVGRDRYQRMLGAQLTVQQHLAAAVCGLMSDPLTLELPVTRDEIDAYITAHADEFAQLSTSIPNETAGRVKRLWLLMLRTRLEQAAAKAMTTAP